MSEALSGGYVFRRLVAAGLTVATYDGWKQHRRPGAWGDMCGVAVHHYGPYGTEAGAVAYARSGSEELPGPLYNILIGRDGRVHLIGWGRANHAGKVDGDVLRAVERETKLPRPNQDTHDGNAVLYGVCLINQGDGDQTYPTAQLDACAATCAVLCRGHDGWTQRSVVAHKELTLRKPDPIEIDMNAFRQRVRDRWGGFPPPQQQPEPGATLAERMRDLERAQDRLSDRVDRLEAA